MPMRSVTRRARASALHHVEAAGLGHGHRRRHPAFQVGGVGAGRDHHVAAFAGHAFADVARRLVEAEMDGLDRGQVVVFEGDVAQQIGQARHRHRPDDRFVGRVDGGGRWMGHVSL